MKNFCDLKDNFVRRWIVTAQFVANSFPFETACSGSANSAHFTMAAQISNATNRIGHQTLECTQEEKLAFTYRRWAALRGPNNKTQMVRNRHWKLTRNRYSTKLCKLACDLPFAIRQPCSWFTFTGEILTGTCCFIPHIKPHAPHHVASVFQEHNKQHVYHAKHHD